LDFGEKCSDCENKNSPNEKFSMMGQKFNRLTVIEYIGKSKDRQLLWKCLCDCGNETVVAGTYLRTGSVKSCGCLKHGNGRIFTKDIAGIRSGKLVAIRPTETRSSGKVVWECKCDCGNTAYVQSTHIINGHSKSCGCYSSEKTIEMNTTHGLTGTRLHSIWNCMKTRCYNPKSKSFSYYGGRGISICEEWLNDFKEFYTWAMSHGYADNLSIDRKDNDLGYSPNNCRWATSHEQRVNQRR
jgi:hypothetical protein